MNNHATHTCNQYQPMNTNPNQPSQPIQVGKITMSQGEPVRAVPIESNGPTEQERRAVWVACFAQLIPRLLADTAAANADICLAEFDKRFTK